VTWEMLQDKLKRFTKENREDMLQEIACLQLEKPDGALEFFYLQALVKIFPRKTRERIQFGSIREEVIAHLRNRDNKAEKLMRLESRMYRVRNKRLQSIGQMYFFDGASHAEIAEEHHIARARATVLIHAFARKVE